jgi:serine/threonine-protein kinase
MSGVASGRYVPEVQIGRGGMATVWRAQDTVLNRPVAVKRLRASLLDDGEIAERFRREAEAVVRLNHPGVVRLLDRGDDGDGPYLVMELVEGEDLKARIAREGPLPPEDAARVCAQVARALAYAHARGVVHRDIKSQNVLLDEDGHAKLADFGIARLMEGTGDSGLTRTGMMVGSSDYLAPEQAEGRPVDGRTDVYALAIVLWECLTGRLPFPGESFVSVAMRHVSDPLPDPRTVRPGIPAQIAACCLRAGAKDPALRFQTAASFAEALEEPGGSDTATMPVVHDPWHRDEGDTARRSRPPRRRRRRTVLTGVAAVLGVAVLGAGGVVGYRALTDGGPAAAPTPPSRPLETTVTAYDPGGSGGENDQLVPAAYDGDPGTAWTTEKYNDTPDFRGFGKTGVGLLLDAGSARPTRLDVTSTTPGAAFEVRREGDLTGPPLVAAQRFTGEAQQVPLPADAPSRLVLWITELQPTPEDPSRYWAGIGEVSLRGVPNRGA